MLLTFWRIFFQQFFPSDVLLVPILIYPIQAYLMYLFWIVKIYSFTDETQESKDQLESHCPEKGC